jgi:hypothetical protein
LHILAKGVDRVHNPLVVGKDRACDHCAVNVLISLPNVFQRGMGFVRVPRANFVEDKSANFWPCKLADFAFYLKADFKGVHVGRLKVEIGSLQEDQGVLHAQVEDLQLCLSCTEGAKVVRARVGGQCVIDSMSINEGLLTLR